MNAIHWRWNDGRYFADLRDVELLNCGESTARARIAIGAAALASDRRRRKGAA